MATTTVRLDDEEERLLDELARTRGGRSAVLRAGLHVLAAEAERIRGLAELVTEWEAEAGPVDEQAIEAAALAYGL